MDSKNYYRSTSFSLIFSLFVSLNLFFFFTYGEKPFCPIQSHALKSKCGRYIKNGGVGVSGDCCNLLREADEVDAGIVYCLCHGADLHKPLTAFKIVRACKLFSDYDVNLTCN